MHAKCFSHVQLSVKLWTVAHWAPLSMGFSRQEYWSGLYALLQGIFPTQGSNPHPHSPASQVDSLPTSHQGGLRCLYIHYYMANVHTF